MRRRKFDATSGLDLFLDAICNTFGGIVFISMLVVILINSTSISSVKVKKETSHQDQKRFAKFTQEKAKLLEETRQQEEATKILGDSSEISELIVKVKVERVTATRLQQQLTTLTTQLAQNKAKTNQTSAKKEQSAAKEEELKSLEQQLQREITKRTKQLTLPIETNTTLVEQAFFLDGGRLIECKAENIKKTADGIVPKPGSGIRVSKSNAPAIQSLFAKYNSKKHYIAVVLWEDSFSKWPTVQAAIRREGFSYRLLLLQKGEKVTTGGTHGKVQQ